MAYVPGVVEWQEGDASRLSRTPMSVDGTFASVLAVDAERKVGVFTSPTGEAAAGSGGQRDLWLLADAPAGVKRARTTFWGSPWMGSGSPDGTILPQHGLGFRYQQAGGRQRAVVIWQNIVFGTTWSVLAGVWASDVSTAASFVNRQVGQIMPGLGDSASILSSSRSNGVVTLVLAEPAPFVADSYARVDVATASFDGFFLIDEVVGNLIRYRQAGANESGGAGSINNVLPYDVDVWSPNGDSVVLVRAKRRNEAAWPDWRQFDPAAGLVIPGSAGNYWSAPPATLATPSQLSVRALITPASWRPAADQTILGKYVTTTSQRCFWLRLKPAGTLEVLYSPAGGTTGSAASTVAIPSDAGKLAVRVDYDESTTSMTFLTSPTMYGPWTQLGDPRTGLAGVGIFESLTAPVEIGSINQGAANQFNGRVHSLTAFPNLTETNPIIDFAANTHPDASTSVTDRAGVVWTRQGTASQANTGQVTDAQAFAVDLNEAGTWASRTGDPTPLGGGAGGAGPVAAHLGTSPLSHVELAWMAFSASDELPMDLVDPQNDQSASIVYWADARDRAYGHPTRDYFLTLADAQEAVVRLSPGQLVEVRGPGT